MSEINALIKDLCPNGVAYSQLGAVTRLVRGQHITKELCIPGPFPVVSASREALAFHKAFNHKGDAVSISSHGAYAGFISFWANEIWLGNNVFLFETNPQLQAKFLYYVLKSRQSEVSSLAKSGGVPYINASQVQALEIPIPPLEVQAELVRILDTFTSLDAELDAEIEARTKQFSYYLDCFYNLETAASTQNLAKLGVFIRGNGLQKIDLQTEGEVPAFHYGQIHTFYRSWATITKSFVGNALKERLRHVQPGDLAIATTAEDNNAVGKAVAWLGNEDAVISGDAFVFRHTLDPLYATYFFQSNAFDIQKQKLITGTKVKRISGDALGKIHIPTPSLERQKTIGLALQKMDGLLSGSEASLPAERTLRKRQCEYYRDQLLTFKEA